MWILGMHDTSSQRLGLQQIENLDSLGPGAHVPCPQNHALVRGTMGYKHGSSWPDNVHGNSVPIPLKNFKNTNVGKRRNTPTPVWYSFVVSLSNAQECTVPHLPRKMRLSGSLSM